MYGILLLMLVGLITFSIFPIVNALTPPSQPEGVTLNAQEDLSKKALGYEAVLEREPDNQTALRGLLEIRLQQGDLPGVVTPLEGLARLNPELSEYGILLAQTKQQLGDNEGAKQAYQTILEGDPGDIKALQGLINLLIPQGESETAIDLIQKTLSENQLTGDNLIGVQLLLAQAYALSDRSFEAIAVYDQMITANPEDFRPLVAKAIVLRDQGDSDTANSLFTQAISLAPLQYQEQIQALAAESLRISE